MGDVSHQRCLASFKTVARVTSAALAHGPVRVVPEAMPRKLTFGCCGHPGKLNSMFVHRQLADAASPHQLYATVKQTHTHTHILLCVLCMTFLITCAHARTVDIHVNNYDPNVALIPTICKGGTRSTGTRHTPAANSPRIEATRPMPQYAKTSLQCVRNTSSRKR